jgi:hypothetical protein
MINSTELNNIKPVDTLFKIGYDPSKNPNTAFLRIYDTLSYNDFKCTYKNKSYILTYYMDEMKQIDMITKALSSINIKPQPVKSIYNEYFLLFTIEDYTKMKLLSKMYECNYPLQLKKD